MIRCTRFEGLLAAVNITSLAVVVDVGGVFGIVGCGLANRIGDRGRCVAGHPNTRHSVGPFAFGSAFFRVLCGVLVSGVAGVANRVGVAAPVGKRAVRAVRD